MFAGRDQEREALERTLAALAAGGPRTAFVTGEPGIGKTRLVAEFAQRAHADGVLVLAGRCDDGLSVPYQPIVEAFEHLVAHAPRELLRRHVDATGDSVARLVPGLGGRSRGHRRPNPGERVRALCPVRVHRRTACGRGERAAEWCSCSRIIHWADPPTVQLLGGWSRPRELADDVGCHLSRARARGRTIRYEPSSPISIASPMCSGWT